MFHGTVRRHPLHLQRFERRLRKDVEIRVWFLFVFVFGLFFFFLLFRRRIGVQPVVIGDAVVFCVQVFGFFRWGIFISAVALA